MPNDNDPDAGSDRRLDDSPSKREELYVRRVEELYDDVAAVRCSYEEAVERAVQAVLAGTRGLLTPAGEAALAERVRAECASDPRLRKTLGGRR